MVKTRHFILTMYCQSTPIRRRRRQNLHGRSHAMHQAPHLPAENLRRCAPAARPHPLRGPPPAATAHMPPESPVHRQTGRHGFGHPMGSPAGRSARRAASRRPHRRHRRLTGSGHLYGRKDAADTDVGTAAARWARSARAALRWCVRQHNRRE